MRVVVAITVFVLIVLIGYFVFDESSDRVIALDDQDQVVSTPNAPSALPQESDDSGGAEQAPGNVSFHEQQNGRHLDAPRGENRIFEDSDPLLIAGAELQELLARKPYESFRVVKVNSDLLREKIRNVEHGDPIVLTLLDGPITIVPNRAEEISEGWRSGFATFSGEIEGSERSKVSFAIAPSGHLRGYFQSPKIGYVAIESIGDRSEHLIWKMRDDVEIRID